MGFLSKIVKGAKKLVKGITGGDLLSAGTDLLGGFLGNSAKQSAADRANQFSAYMSNTSYQRTIEDMKKAGINPAVAYSQGGASTPTGQQADVEGYSKVSGKAITNAVTAAQVANTKANTTLQASQANSTDVNAAKTVVDRQNALLDQKLLKNEIKSSHLDLAAKESLSPTARAYIGALGSVTSSARDAAGAYNTIRNQKRR